MGLSKTFDWAKSLGKKLAAVGITGGVLYIAYLGAEGSIQGQEKQRSLVAAFDEAGLSEQKSKLVQYVLDSQNGNCALLNDDLAPRCEQVKAALAPKTP